MTFRHYIDIKERGLVNVKERKGLVRLTFSDFSIKFPKSTDNNRANVNKVREYGVNKQQFWVTLVLLITCSN